MSTFQSAFLVAETDSATFSGVTGLVEGRGFVLEGERRLPAGIYSRPHAESLARSLVEARLTHHVVPAENFVDGRRKLRATLNGGDATEENEDR